VSNKMDESCGIISYITFHVMLKDLLPYTSQTPNISFHFWIGQQGSKHSLSSVFLDLLGLEMMRCILPDRICDNISGYMSEGIASLT